MTNHAATGRLKSDYLDFDRRPFAQVNYAVADFTVAVLVQHRLQIEQVIVVRVGVGVVTEANDVSLPADRGYDFTVIMLIIGAIVGGDLGPPRTGRHRSGSAGGHLRPNNAPGSGWF